jgi:acyl-CoA reductase-like NAD-dependent aldehyde dehydrogenase
VRRNIAADNAGNANGLSHFCAYPGEAPPRKSSAIITTLAQRGEISPVAQTGLQFDPRIAQRDTRLNLLSAAAHNRTKLAGDHAGGYHIEPTVLEGHNKMRVFQEEIFGPVVRVWTNCYHAYPPHAAFGGHKKSGIGRETHKMMLNHYQQTKHVLVNYSTKALGFF